MATGLSGESRARVRRDLAVRAFSCDGGDVDVATATSALRQVLGRDDLAVERLTRLGRPRAASTFGVYHVDYVDGRAGACRVIVKVLRRNDGHDGLPREAELYAGQHLPNVLPPGAAEPSGFGAYGLGAPRQIGISDLPEGRVGIWLEVVQGRPIPWPTLVFGTVAEHLASFTRTRPGPTLAAAQTVEPRDLCTRTDLMAANLNRLDQLAAHPLIGLAYPSSVVRDLRRIHDTRGVAMSGLVRAPRGLCHGDAQCHNLFPQSDRCTIAVDWANLATGPQGIDAATLFFYGLAYFDHDVHTAETLDHAIFDGYLRGLDTSEATTHRRVRLSYLTQLIYGIQMLEVSPVVRLITDPAHAVVAEEFYQRDVDEILTRRASITEFIIGLDREARGLARTLQE